MPLRFTQGEIKRVLKWMGYQRVRKGSNIYIGIDAKGKPSTVKFDYHKDRDQVAIGTGKQIVRSLGFKIVEDLKVFIRNKGK